MELLYARGLWLLGGLVPLVLFTARREVMGGLVNARATTVSACVVAAVNSTTDVSFAGTIALPIPPASNLFANASA